MTPAERVQAVMDFGFTERQARFLGLVMRHSGVCVPRQFATAAGVPNGGHQSNAFFARLVRRGLAVRSDCVHNRAQVYHVNHRALYGAIGELTSRCRRRISPRLAVERLMLLDALIASPNVEWLSGASEAVARLSLSESAPGNNVVGPLERATEDARLGALRFPVGVDSAGRGVLVYVASDPATEGFRTFLQEYTSFLPSLAAWTIRLVFPRPLERFYAAYQTVIREELESPLHPANVTELKWYFEHRRQAADEAVDGLTEGLLDVGAKVFGTPRFGLLYRRWLKHGSRVLDGLSSTAMAEALAEGRGQVDCLVLPYSYRHLFTLVSSAGTRCQVVDQGATRVATRPTRPQPPSSTTPPLQTPATRA